MQLKDRLSARCIMPSIRGRIFHAVAACVRIPMLPLCRHAVARLEFLCVETLLSEARREPMLDLALFIGFALICLYIAYERLSNRL
jgi:hypothetical protein